MYLGLSQNRDDIEWYIGWYFLYRIGMVLPIVYLSNWQYLQVVIFITLSLTNMLITLNFRPFMFQHNLYIELLNQSLVFMIGMLLYSFTPFMTDATWRISVGYFILVQIIIVTGADLILTWHAIMWQVFWRMEQEEKVYEAIIQRSQTQIQRQKTRELEQVKATQLHSINEQSDSDSEEEMENSRVPLNDLE